MGVGVELQGLAAVVTLDWPDKRNAIGPDDADEVADAIHRAEHLRGATCVVLSGAGRAFCAGGDLPAILAVTRGADAGVVERVVYTRFQGMARALRDCERPTVAAIDGAAVGLGLDLALWCDRRYFGPRTRLLQGWAALGLVPGIGGAALLERVSTGLLWESLGAGGAIPLELAERRGLGTPVDDALEAARSYAEALAPVGDAALQHYTRLGRLHLPDDDYLAACARAQSQLLTSAEFDERVAALGMC